MQALRCSSLHEICEPTLQAAEQWLSYYQARGEIDHNIDLRFAAIALYSPLLILLMHQHQLGGAQLRKAEVDQFVEQHSKNFLKYLRQ